MNFRPFTPTAVVNVAEIPGVFEIVGENRRSLFVGTSNNLQFALMGVLANPDKYKSLFDLKPKAFGVEYIDNPQGAALMKQALIAQNHPAAQQSSEG